MRWTRGHRSSNVEDRRGGGGRARTVMMGGGGVVGLIVALLFVTGVLDTGAGGPAPGVGGPAGEDPDAELKSFVSFVLDDAQATWTRIFRERGASYREAKLVLFSDAIDSACGYAQSAIGPFYCPGDQKVYLDMSFFHELSRRFGAPGDFAQAYVIAHEVGHHVQTLLGTSQAVHARKQRNPREANALSVRLELQADCFAGVWAYGTARRDLLEAGDIEEGLGAAAAIGDDRLQKKAGGRVAPETFTHGTSAQRVRWFRRGFETGDVDACDTFSATAP